MTLPYERIGASRVKTAEETADARRVTRGFWYRCDDPRGTPAEAYLRSRGLPHLAEMPSVIRFRPDCPHPSGQRLPAMVTLIYDGTGDIAATHRTYLTADGRKADIQPNKTTKGSYAGGAIRLYPACAEMLVAEGVETAASAALLLDIPAWSGVACGNIRERMVLPAIVRSVIIAADHDRPGRRAAAGAAQRWRAEGRTVRIVQPDTPGQDFNDIMCDRLEVQHA